MENNTETKMTTPVKKQLSFPQLKYPSLRDAGWKDPSQWLDGKCIDDDTQSYWRIHDKLYDLTDFIKKHPGGEDWLVLTKGTDITEAFESHHIIKSPEQLLPKFFLKDATSVRNSPFTFEDNGFYNVLKRRLRIKLKEIDTAKLSRQSDIITDSLLAAFLSLLLLSCLVESKIAIFAIILLNGIVLGWSMIASHNYIHKRDNWRMYIWNFGTVSYRDARIRHALSHHMYTNTLMDAEVSEFEPIGHYLPNNLKPSHIKYFNFYAPLILLIPFWFQFVRKIILSITKEGYFLKYMLWNDLIALLPPLFMHLFTSASLLKIIIVWLTTVNCGNSVMILIGLTAGHHHPDSFHEGDVPRGNTVDWGEHQLETVIDRVEASGNVFMRLTHFGDHALHHLFPTIDHAILPHLYPTFNKVCEEFQCEYTKFRSNHNLNLCIGHQEQVQRLESSTVESRFKLDLNSDL